MKPDQPRESHYEFGKESTRVMDDELVQTLADQSRTEDGVVFEEPPTVPRIREIPEPPPASGTRLRAATHAGVIVSIGALLMLGLGHHDLFRRAAAPPAAPPMSNVLGVFELPARMSAALDRARTWLEARPDDSSDVKKSAEPDRVDNAEHGGRTKHHHHRRG